MTVSNEVYRHDYMGNGSTVLFAIGFYFLVDAHIRAILYNSVTEIETELTLTTHYTLTGAGNTNGGELTMIITPTSDETLTILRNVDLKQEKNYVEGTSFPAEDHEAALDKLTMLVQQIQEQLNRIVIHPESYSGILEFPMPVEGYFLRWVSNQLESYDIADLSLYSVSQFVETLLDDANASAFLATLGLDTDLLTTSLPANTTISTFINTLLDDVDAAAARATLEINTMTPGLAVRAKFTWKDANEIYIDPFVYHHHGSVEQLLYCDSRLTFTFANLVAYDWSYLYLDDSAVVTADTNIITVGELIDSVTEPTWNAAKHGWYNGNDRCMFAVLADGSGNISEFFHEGDLVVFAEQVTAFGNQDVDTTWVEVTLPVPSFVRQASVLFIQTNVGGGAVGSSWRTEGQVSSLGHYAGRTSLESVYSLVAAVVHASSALKIEVRMDTSDTTQLAVYTNGWYFSIGM